MDELRLSVLGRLRIEHGSQPLAGLTAAKAKALLVYLAVTAVPHSRQTLASLLWPEVLESSARSSLRSVLSHLNEIAGAYIVASRHSVALNGELRIWVDAIHFEDACRQLLAKTLPLSENERRQLRGAVHLYRGDFLDEFYGADTSSFEEWLLHQREHYRQRALTALEWLTADALARAALNEGIEDARRMLELDSLHEPAYRQLMTLLARSGRRSTALAQFESCRQLLKTELGVEPDPSTIALAEEIRTGALADSRPAGTAGADYHSSATERVQWDEAPGGGAFVGREEEQETLRRWLLHDRCRLVAVLGMGGMGKTALVTKVALELQEHFDYLLWCSLREAPPLEEILTRILRFLSSHQVQEVPAGMEEQSSLLLELLRQRRCLVVLDNGEAILREGEHSGHYRPGYEGYGRLLQRLGERVHQSCIVLTSREKPTEFAALEGETAPVRVLEVRGLGLADGRTLLRDKGLSASDADWAKLNARYSGNPLALKLIAESIRELFAGDVGAFLQDDIAIFGNIRDLLAQQFGRLSRLEQELMMWLAVEREAVAVERLYVNLLHPPTKPALLEALRSLRRRSLVETSAVGFMLQNVVMEYMTDSLVERVGQELVDGRFTMMHSHVMSKAQAKEYVRQSQQRLIVQRVVERLLAGSDKSALVQRLRGMISDLQAQGGRVRTYAGGNLITLLLALPIELRGWDFSNLPVWQAHLRDIILQDVSFRGADLQGAVFFDAFGEVLSVAISPDGEQLAGASSKGVLLWRMPDGQPLQTPSGYASQVFSVDFHADGTLLAGGCYDHTIRLWDVHSGQCVKTLQSHRARVWAVQFSPDGRLLASGGGAGDHTVRLWDVRSGQCLHELHGHSTMVWSICFSPDGEVLASASGDQSVYLWHVQSGEFVARLPETVSAIRSLCYSPNGQMLATGSIDGTVRLWDVDSQQWRGALQAHPGYVTCLRFSPDGATLATSGSEGTVRLWDVQSGERLHILYGQAEVESVCFHPNGRLLVSGGTDRSVRLWDVHSGRCLHTLQGYENQTKSVAFHPGGKVVASSGAGDNTMRLWDVDSGRCLGALRGHTEMVRSLSFSPTGKLLASASFDHTVRLWDVQSFQSLKTLYGHTGRMMSVAFSTDGRLLASGSQDKSVRVWDVENGQCLHVLQGHTDAVNHVCFSCTNLLASGSYDCTVRLWDIANGHCLAILEGHSHPVGSLCFSPDGRTLASGSQDAIRLWDVESRQCRQVLAGNTCNVPVTFSPDGRTLASGGIDRTIRLWDVASGDDFRFTHDATSMLWSISFSPDGATLVSSSSDGTIKLWDVQTGTCLRIMQDDRPYERMDITGVTGLSEVQKATLKALGAVEEILR